MKHHLESMCFFDVLPLSKEKYIEHAMGQIGNGASIYCKRGNGFVSMQFDKFLKGRRKPFS
jgi:hypothetical protein